MPLSAELQKVDREIADIKREGEELGRARQALAWHQEALDRLQPHETLIGKAKRLFSPEARAAHKDALARVQITQGGVDRWGTPRAPWG